MLSACITFYVVIVEGLTNDVHCTLYLTDFAFSLLIIFAKDNTGTEMQICHCLCLKVGLLSKIRNWQLQNIAVVCKCSMKIPALVDRTVMMHSVTQSQQCNAVRFLA